MICPVDNSDMIVVEHNKIELDYCTKCHGVWFDSGEMELLLESIGHESHRQFLENILKSDEAGTTEKRHKCPICRQKMKKTNVGEKPGLLIDVCQRGDGLWFDGGEVGQLLKQLAKPAAKGSPQNITGFLSEVFKARDQ